MTIWILLNPILLVLCLYYYAVGLTRRESYRRRLERADVHAAPILKLMQRPEHRSMSARDRGYRRRYLLGNLPLLLDDVRACLQGASSLPTILLGLWFYAFLGLVWIKAHLWPGQDDLRALIGVEMLLLRTSS